MSSVINPDNGELNILGSMSLVAGPGTSANLTLVAKEVSPGNWIHAKLSIDDTSDIDLNTPIYGDGALNVVGGGYFGGNLYVGGTLVANGDVITLGNGGGSLTLNANISSDILPSDTDTYNVGSTTAEWNYGFFRNIVLDSNEETINTSVSNTQAVSYITSSTSNSITLADGEYTGQIKVIVAIDDISASPVQLTPDTPLGFNYFIFNATGQTVTLMYTYAGWAIITNRANLY
jgi:hypothetical protein